jgi:isocitrate dehydrogenase kinase/phosphatase
VFKVIKDFYPPPKETTRAGQAKYLLVKHTTAWAAWPTRWNTPTWPSRATASGRAGGGAEAVRASLVEEEGDQIIIKHLYIERRMVPLNIWLTEKENDEAQLEHGMLEYGNAIKELVAANIFPGDMLYKNFGVTRHQRVVFYDYDEIEYITDCKFRAYPSRATKKKKWRRSRGTRSVNTTSSPSSLAASCWGTKDPQVLHEAPRRPAHARFWQARKHRQGLVEDSSRTRNTSAFPQGASPFRR